jgi:hypothetical protein
MGHEATLYGVILAGDGSGGEGFHHIRRLQLWNHAILNRLPSQDDWPWLVRGMFNVPYERPVGLYRTQVITFGESLKDDPSDRGCWNEWLEKFETLLRRLYWWSAVVHLRTDFEGERVIQWTPTAEAVRLLWDDPPQPICLWTRSDRRVVPDSRFPPPHF